MRRALARSVTSLSTPPIPEVQGWGDAYDGSHGPLANFSQAVPGYAPHPDLHDWAAECARSCVASGYGLIEGEPELVAALSAFTGSLYGSPVADSEIQITAGCNQAYFVALMTITNPGDEVVLTNPNFFNHEATLTLLGLRPAYVDCLPENGFLPRAEDVAAQITDRTAAVALVTPNNPTGAVYPPALLQDIYDICAEKGVWLILDETYRDFLAPDAGAPHRLFEAPSWRDHFIQLYSFSKGYCIPGHRVGAMVAASDIVTETVKVMDNLQICAPRPAQQAVAKALPALSEWRAANSLEMQSRGAAFQEALGPVAGWNIRAVGAFFAYVEHPFGGRSSRDVARELAEGRGIVALPGTYFGTGQEPYLRFAFANSDAETIGLLAARL
ncbi:MAG: aminotransferase [Pseudomonadota bacterium]